MAGNGLLVHGGFQLTRAQTSDGRFLCTPGEQQGSFLPDLWLLQRQAADGMLVWTELAAAGGGPGARAFHAMAAVGDGQALVLFGGFRVAAGGQITALNDTWLYFEANNSFVELQPAGGLVPPSRGMHTGVVVRDVTIPGAAPGPTTYLLVFGGTPLAIGGLSLNDTWALDLGGQTWYDLSGPGSPSPRHAHAAVALPDGRMVISAGCSVEDQFRDTWLFDPSSRGWQAVQPWFEDAALPDSPLARTLHWDDVWGHSMTVVSSSETHVPSSWVRFGGLQGSQTLQISFATNRFQQMFFGFSAPEQSTVVWLNGMSD